MSRCQSSSKTNGTQCSRESSSNSNHCWQHKEKSTKSEKSAKPPIGINTCYLYLNMDSDYISEVLYGTDQILDKLKECDIDGRLINEFIEIKKEFSDEQQNLLERCKVYFSNNKESVGKRIVKKLKYIKKYILTPQLDKTHFVNYEKFIENQIEEIEYLGKDFNQITDTMVKIINESMKYPQSTGILYVLSRLILNYFHEAENIVDDIEEYTLMYSNVTTKYLSTLTGKYFKIDNNFSLKTISTPTSSSSSSGSTTITIKKGSIFYKGVSNESYKRLTDMDDYFWMGYDIITAKAYAHHRTSVHTLNKFCEEMGFIGIYEMNDDINLLDMSNINTIKQLKLEIKDKDILKALNYSFIISVNDNGHEIINRKSASEIDLIWVQWLCENGYDGYTADKFEDPHFGRFPAETMLCHPQKHIKYLGYYDVTDMDFHYCSEPYINYDIDILHM